MAKKYQEAGQLERALVELQEAVQLDPTNQYAQVELDKVREQLKAKRDQFDYATSLDTLKERNRGALAQPPVLDPRSDEPIDLDFPEAVSVMDIYRALGKAFGINVLFDPRLRDQEIAIELKQVTAQDALEILMRASGHFYKVVDSHSIIIAADTPQNRRAYEDLMIQTFFLSNAEVRDVMTMLRSLVDARKIAANERLNAIVLRDTADRVKVAEKLIEVNDKARSEVVIDVELMQINSSKLRELGVSMDPYQIGFTLDGEQVEGGDGDGDGVGAASGSIVRLSDLEFIDSSSWLVTVPSFLVDFVKENTDAHVLAKPQLRISEGEKANLVIGDKVPIPVTSFNTANTIGGNIVPLTSFQYTDVGITINIEPRVHHNNEVTLKVMVEISNISGNVGLQPIIGTRHIDTTIRLKDGETNFLAGLIRTDEVDERHRHPRALRHPGHRPAVRSQVEPGAAHRHRAHAHAAHHPPRRHHRRRPAADLGRHRDQLQLPRRQPARRVGSPRTVRRRRPGAGRSGGGAGAPAPAARAAPAGCSSRSPPRKPSPRGNRPAARSNRASRRRLAASSSRPRADCRGVRRSQPPPPAGGAGEPIGVGRAGGARARRRAAPARRGRGRLRSGGAARRRRPLRGGGAARRRRRRASRARAVAAGGGGGRSLRGRARGDGGDRGVAPPQHAVVRPPAARAGRHRGRQLLRRRSRGPDLDRQLADRTGGGRRQPDGPHPRRRRTRQAADAALPRAAARRGGDPLREEARARRVPAGGGTARDLAGEDHHRRHAASRRRWYRERPREALEPPEREAPRSEEP